MEICFLLVNPKPYIQKSKFQYLNINKTHTNKQQYTSQSKYFCKIWYFYKTSRKIFCNSINWYFLGEFFRDIFYWYYVCSLPGVIVSQLSSMHTLIPNEPFSWSSCPSHTWYCCVRCRVLFYFIFYLVHFFFFFEGESTSNRLANMVILHFSWWPMLI